MDEHDRKMYAYMPHIPSYWSAVWHIVGFMFIAGCSFCAAVTATGYCLIEQSMVSTGAFIFVLTCFMGAGLFMSWHWPQAYRSNVMGLRGDQCNATTEDVFVVVALGWFPSAILGVWLMLYGFPG